MTLSTRLTLTMVSLVLVTAAVGGFITYHNLTEAVLPSELARLHVHAERQAAHLETVIDSVYSDVQVFVSGTAAFEGIIRARSHGGTDPETGDTEEVWRMRLARRFSANLEAKADYVQIRFIGVADGGREIVRVDRSGPDGSVHVRPVEELQAKAGHDYFTETIKLPPGAIYLSRIDLNQEHGKIELPHLPVIRAAMPVYSSGGEVFGLLIINVDLRPSFHRMRTPEHAGGQVFLVNHQGHYLLHPDTGKTFGFDLGGTGNLSQDYPGLAAALGSPAGFVRLTGDRAGEKVGAAVVPLRTKGAPWMAVVEVAPTSALLAAVAPVRRSSLLAGGLVALLAVGLAVGFGRSLANPLTTLTRTINSVSAGGSPAVKITAGGEIGQLAQAFAHMQREMGAKTEALQRSEHRFRALIEHSADGISLVDADDRILYLSPSVTLIEGYKPEELVGRNAMENTHPDDQPLVAEAFKRLLASPDRPVSVLWRRRHKDGRWLWLEGVASNLLHDSAIGAIVTNYRDVTERKRHEARFRRLVESNAQGVIFWSARGEIVDANDAFLQMTGYTRDDLAAGCVNWVAMTSPEYAHRDRQALAELAVRGVCAPFEKEYLRKDGTRVPVLLGAALLEDQSEDGVCFVLDITARKAAEAEVHASEERFRTMANSMAQLAWIAQADGHIHWYNERWYAYTGTTLEQMVGWGWQSVHDPAMLPQVMARWQAAIASGQPFEMEFPLRGADGRFRMFLTRGQPLKDAQGRVLQWFGTNTDVDELKQMEASLRATQARLSSTLAAGSIGTWTWDIGNDRLVADEFTARVFGISQEEAAQGLPASVYLQAVLAEDQPAVTEGLARAIESCGRYDIEYRIRQKDGGFLWLQARGRVEGDAAGKAAYFHGAVLDITGRKQAEAALRMSEEYFRFLNDLGEATRPLADPAQIMAATARRLGGHLRASRCAYADVAADGERFTILHDYTNGCASTVGQYRLSLFGPRAVATLQAGQTLIIRNVATELLPGEGADTFSTIGIQAIICCPLVKEDGLRAMMAVHQTTARDWQPDEIALVQEVVERCWATIQRRTAEEKIRQLNAGLEQRVIERTEQLAAANRELEAFSYSVSHDLRAPLRGIAGFTEVLIRDYQAKLDATGVKYLERVIAATERMGHLIDDLLNLSRVTRVELVRQTVDLSALARSTAESLRHADPGRAATTFTIADGITSEGDPRLLRIVLENLLGNAWKFTAHQPAAHIEFGGQPGPDGRSACFVRDNGAGFDMAYAGRLFAPFQRLHTTTEFPGTGIGLATVNRIIQRHGGRVWAESRPGAGATFYFRL